MLHLCEIGDFQFPIMVLTLLEPEEAHLITTSRIS